MNPQQADTLAKRIINTFRQTPALTEWRDVLGKLDHDRATTTFELCRATIDDRLSIARYLAEYRQQPVPLPNQPPSNEHIVPPHIGRQIAWQSYNEECMRLGKAPDYDWFTRMIACIGKAEANP